MRSNVFTAIILFIIAPLGFLAADVTLPSIVGSNMVIQQNSPFVLWGWADPGENVVIRADWLEKPVEVMTGDEKEWRVTLPPPQAGGPYRITIKGYNSIVLDNILCGEVWLASGQSNMAWPMRKTARAAEELPRARHDDIRLFHVNRTYASSPRSDVKARWQLCEPEAVDNFSAVAYYFARMLKEKLKVPVGIISSSKGGSPIEAWISEAVLREGNFTPALDSMWQNWSRRAPEDEKRYQQALKEWREKVKAGEVSLKKPRIPVSVKNLSTKHRRPAALYNAMIAPLENYAIKGVIWYQGESNVPRTEQFAGLFPALIKSWAAQRNRPYLPFYFSQIAPYDYKDENGPASRLREVQAGVLNLPHTGMAVITDVGNLNDIHPIRKKEVGERLALLALAGEYKMDTLKYSGPVLKTARKEGADVLLSFDFASSGLVQKGDRLTGFELAGPDGRFYPAEAKIEGRQIRVYSSAVEEPRQVRFGWHIEVIPNLFNGDDLPAYPFTARVAGR